MKSMRVAFGLLIGCLALCLTACSNDGGYPGEQAPIFADNVVVVSEDLGVDTTWLADKVYYINSAIEVYAILTIPAGTVVKFGSGGKLSVSGSITAVGTTTQIIRFTSIKDDAFGGDSILNDGSGTPSRGNWYGLQLSEGSGPNTFSYCNFAYAGKETNAALDIYGKTNVNHCTFHHNLGGNPYAVGEYAALDARICEFGTLIENNLFYSNLWPLTLPAHQSIYDSNIFTFDHDEDAGTPVLTNTHQAIMLYYSGQIEGGTVIWDEASVPLCVFDDDINSEGRIIVSGDGELRIGVGVIMKFYGSDAQLFFAIDSNYTISDTAIFTSYRDDVHGGDTNADGTASVPAVGDWIGIWDGDLDDYLSLNIHYSEY